MIPLGNEHFEELARQVAAGKASNSMCAELKTLLRQEPALKKEFDRILKEAQLLREVVPLLEALDAPPRPFPASARERLQTKVRQTLGRPTRGARAKTKILLVDDEQSFTSLWKSNLEETGSYEVRVENRAEDAHAAAREFKPHLILLDLIMPRLPGGQVAAQIMGDPQLKHTPIVYLTAAVRRHQVEEHDGIISDFPCLTKPATLERVIEVIKRYAR